MRKLFLPAFVFFCSSLHAQQALKVDDIVPDFAIAKILNPEKSKAFLSNYTGEITVLDFFGTWCVPCLRALPAMQSIKTQYPQVNFLLISIEKEEKLKSFIEKRMPFHFAIAVDEDEKISGLFQPPAYPYTVIVGKGNKVIDILSNTELTPEKMQAYIELNSKSNLAVSKPPSAETITVKNINNTTMAPFTAAGNSLIQLSQEFMYAAKTNSDVSSFISRLKGIDYSVLQDSLKTDDEKKAFWINLYNAFVNASLHQNPELYKKRSRFFKAKDIEVAGKTFSLDKIEHGILRRSKVKWGLGYINKLFPIKTEKELRVKTVDYRIHFALNCGAKSCPPIAFYKSEDLEKQLELATTAYLTGEVEYNSATNVLQVPVLLSWFRGDFGGRKKALQMLKERKIIPENIVPKIKFKKYDWSLYLDNFKN